MHDHARLDRIRVRLGQLAELDAECVVFGSPTHAWVVHDPLERDTIGRFEHDHEVDLPEQLRVYLEQVSGSGAGPFYGLLGLPASDEAQALALSDRFVADLGESAVDRDPERRGGYLPLAEQGCGYRSVLVLAGPRRGQVMADMREAHEGFIAEAPSFLAWIEDWLDRALAEWAERSLPDLVARREPVPLLDELEPLLERRAEQRETGAIHPYSEVERLDALMLLRIHRGRFEAAEALVERSFTVDTRDAAARRQLGLARIAGARDDAEARLAAAERGLAESTWHATKTELLRERERALLDLDRRADAIATMIARADHSRHLHAHYDAAWHLLDDGEVEAALAVLIRAAEHGVGCEREGSLAERVDECAEGLLAALHGDERSEQAERLRASIHALESRPLQLAD